MTEWYPDTCNCVIDVESKEFIRRCKTHRTVKQVENHNRSFNTRSATVEEKQTEKEKAEFQRDPNYKRKRN